MLVGQIGQDSLLVALLLISTVLVLSIVESRRPSVVVSRYLQVLTIAQFLFVALASACLIVLLVTLNFHYQYVVDYTSRSLSPLYRIAAFWGGDAGSLLFWLLVTSAYLLVVRLVRHAGSADLLPIVSAIMALVLLFFAGVLNTVARPFTTLAVAPADGNGLNALLQNPGMTVHPVNLYLGYVGFLVPYAYGMAALLLRRTDALWLQVTRRWTLISWLFLSCGIIYGAHWSYEELGWGGYWAWDPIENAALMPWLAATAFLHSAMVQERKGLLKAWNVVLISLTYLLTLFGTALTRGGLLWSIHSFANGSLGTVFMSFVAFMTLFTVSVLAWRGRDLKGVAQFEAVLSKETGFLMNNVLLIGALFAVLWGTVFPLVSEAVTGSQMLVSGPFYDSVVLPIGVAVIFLMGVGPVLAWRRTDAAHLTAYLAVPFAVAAGVGVLTWLAGYHSVLSLFAYLAATLVCAVIGLEFLRGARARAAITGEGVLLSLGRMIAKNRRRYGGYVVHLAVVLMVIGFATSGAYAKQETANLEIGQTVAIGNYLLTFHGLNTVDKRSGVLLQGSLVVQTAEGKTIGVLDPNVEFFQNGQSPTTNLGLYSTPLADLYVVLDGANFKTGESLFEIHLNPLVSLIWWGGYLYIAGTFVSLWPERKRRRQAWVSAVTLQRERVYKELAELALDHGMGKLGRSGYERTRGQLMGLLNAEPGSEHDLRERLGVQFERQVLAMVEPMGGGEHA